MAGFPQTWSGLWAYVDIQVGDFLSFLYGGRAHNLYQVTKKEAIKNPENLPPPWEPIQTGKKVIHFPYRLYLQPVREFNEILARREFLYITENLLRRGGIRKSHFQADRVTLCNVSSMGEPACFKPKDMSESYTTFIPKFVAKSSDAQPPEFNYLREEFVHSVLRIHLSHQEILRDFLEELNIHSFDGQWEVLGERALERGYVDLLIKEAMPQGEVQQVVIEVKSRNATSKDVTQLLLYMDEIGKECVAGAIIASKIPKKLTCEDFGQRIHFWEYGFKMGFDKPRTFEELCSAVYIEKIT